MYHSGGDADGEGCVWGGGQGVYGNSLYFLPNIAMNLKLLQKVYSICLKSLLE